MLERLRTCSICSVLAGEKDEGSIAVSEDGWSLMPALHQAPQNRGHMILVPDAHRERLEDLGAESTFLPSLLVRATKAVRQAFDATGTTIRQNDGPPAQDTPHVHFHIVPRHDGDGFWDAPIEVVPLPELIDQARLFALHWP